MTELELDNIAVRMACGRDPDPEPLGSPRLPPDVFSLEVSFLSPDGSKLRQWRQGARMQPRSSPRVVAGVLRWLADSIEHYREGNEDYFDD